MRRKKGGKGRDGELIARRDAALLRRYYYWTETQRLRFDDTLRVLSRNEFFISEERIMAILRRKLREGEAPRSYRLPRVRKPKITVQELELFPE